MEKLFLITDIKLIILSILAMIVFFSFLKIKKPPQNVAKASFSILILFIVALYVLYLLQIKYNYIHSFMVVSVLFCLIYLLILKLNKLYTRKNRITFHFFNNNYYCSWIQFKYSILVKTT